MTFNLLVTANAFRVSGDSAEAPVREAGGALLYPPKMGPIPVDDLIPWVAQADAVIAAGDPYTDVVLAACPRVRVIVRWGTGYDTVDLDACTRHGVLACNAPGQNVAAVADHTLATLLGIVRDVPRQVGIMRSGRWDEVRGVELYRKTVGLVGFGAIGRAVARRLRGFDCRILAFDPHAQNLSFTELGAQRVDLPTLFAESDFVSLHAALTPESRGMVTRELIGRMKPSAYFINAARGPLVDEEALVEALQHERIAGAALDAFCHEPLPADHVLRTLPNCLPTPHSAFNTTEAADATNRAVLRQVFIALRGECPDQALNPAVLEAANYRGRVPLI